VRHGLKRKRENASPLLIELIPMAEAVTHLEMNACDAVKSRVVLGASDSGRVAIYHVDSFRPQ
jgi:hypothetical protein